MNQAMSSSRKEVDLAHVLSGIMKQEESYAVYYLSREVESPASLLAAFNEESSREPVCPDMEECTEDEDSEMDASWMDADTDGKWKIIGWRLVQYR